MIELRDLPIRGKSEDLAKKEFLILIIEQRRLMINDSGNKGGSFQESGVHQQQEIYEGSFLSSASPPWTAFRQATVASTDSTASVNNSVSSQSSSTNKKFFWLMYLSYAVV
jgi:hypothetical protein